MLHPSRNRVPSNELPPENPAHDGMLESSDGEADHLRLKCEQVVRKDCSHDFRVPNQFQRISALEEICSLMHLTRERIRQLENLTLARLRRLMGERDCVSTAP